MENNPKSKKLALTLYDFIEMIIIAIAITILTFMFAGRLTVVDGPSMMKTLSDKDVLVVTNLGYAPQTDDIVVFQQPDGRVNGAIVKRVIATEGQTVDIDFDNWIVYVDGKPLYTDEIGNPEREPYVNYDDFEGRRMNEYDIDFPITVGKGQVFVMGDNRNQSTDSRSSAIGTVDERYIFGKVLFRVSPLSELGKVN